MKRFSLFPVFLLVVCMHTLSAHADEVVHGKLSKIVVGKEWITAELFSATWLYEINTTKERITEPTFSLVVLLENSKGAREITTFLISPSWPESPTDVYAQKVKTGKASCAVALPSAVHEKVAGEKPRKWSRVYTGGKDERPSIVDYLLYLWCGTELLDVVPLKTDKQAKTAAYPAEWLTIRAEAKETCLKRAGQVAPQSSPPNQFSP